MREIIVLRRGAPCWPCTRNRRAISKSIARSGLRRAWMRKDCAKDGRRGLTLFFELGHDHVGQAHRSLREERLPRVLRRARLAWRAAVVAARRPALLRLLRRRAAAVVALLRLLRRRAAAVVAAVAWPLVPAVVAGALGRRRRRLGRRQAAPHGVEA